MRTNRASENGETRSEPSPRGLSLVLAIDFGAQPYSLGDLLILLTVGMAKAQDAGCTRVVYALLSDPDRPPIDPVMATYATRENHMQRLMALLPVLQIDPMLGEMHVFASASAFGAFISERAREGHPIWPSLAELRARKYLYYDALKAIHQFYLTHGALPAYRFNKDLSSFAKGLFGRLARGRVPVSVNLRNNPSFHVHRNAQLEVWREFFGSATRDFPVAFFVTGSPSEMDPAIRACPHVFYTKDRHTDMLQDLALIHEASFHIGSSSGPSTLAFFLRKPYFIANTDAAPHVKLYGGSLVHEPGGDLRFAFAAPLQSLGVENETASLLRQRLERIWASRDFTGDLAMPGRGDAE